VRCFCTVVTRSHLGYVGSLAQSLRASGNAEDLWVLVADASQGELPADGPGVRHLAYESVEAGLPPLIRYYYDAFELSNALKPFLLTRLLGECGASQVVYLDSDLLVTGSFEPVWDGFGGASLLLSAHQFTPPAMSERFISEVGVVDMGFLNGGFAAWRAGPAADRILEWMRTRFVAYGFCDRKEGMFVDQKLLPLLLQYFPDDVRILRHPGVNIAFWNAYERDVRKGPDGRWRVGGQEVIFFHLSGYRLSMPGVPCTYLEPGVNAGILGRSPWMSEVLSEYHAVLGRHQPPGPAPGYPFTSYDGVPLTQEFRRLLFEKGAFDRGSYAFWRVWARERLRGVKRLLRRIGIRL
jgi:hypothetical protein